MGGSRCRAVGCRWVWVGGSQCPGGAQVLPGAAQGVGCGPNLGVRGQALPGPRGPGPAGGAAGRGSGGARGGARPGCPAGIGGSRRSRGSPPPNPPAPCRFRGAAGRGQPGSHPTWPGPRQPMRAPISERSPYMAMFSAEEAGLSGPGYKGTGLAAVRSHSAGGSGSGGTVTAAPTEATPAQQVLQGPTARPRRPFPHIPWRVGWAVFATIGSTRPRRGLRLSSACPLPPYSPHTALGWYRPWVQAGGDLRGAAWRLVEVAGDVSAREIQTGYSEGETIGAP